MIYYYALILNIHRGLKEFMRIAICDDDKEFLKSMRSLLERSEPSLDNMVSCYQSGERLLEAFESKEVHYDVIFMDIELEGMDGITLAKKLRAVNDETFLVFLTNYAEYAIAGYEARAFRYLLKPVDEKDIQKLLADIRKEWGSRQSLRIMVESRELLLPLEKINYMDAQKKYTTIYAGEQQYLSRVSLSDYEKQLQDKGFFRIHRKYLVNLCNITGWDKHWIEVDGQRLPVSYRKEKEFREQLYAYLEKGVGE